MCDECVMIWLWMCFVSLVDLALYMRAQGYGVVVQLPNTKRARIDRYTIINPHRARHLIVYEPSTL